MDIQVVNGNILEVDGRFLQSNELDKLRIVLTTEGQLVFDALLDQYERQKSLNPDSEIKQSSLWLMRLAKNIGEVITEEALELDKDSQENRGVFTRVKDMQPAYKGHWHAVAAGGYLPEIREASGPKHMKGICLLAKVVEPQKLYDT